MKVTWSWLADWVDLPSTPQALAHELAMRGLPVESIEQGVALDPTIVVGKVLEVAPHPNADRLRLCSVDIGSTRVSVVCGASNVAAGQFVAVAQVGSRLHDGTKLRKSKIRGVESEGMICSERELGLALESEGIWAIPGNPEIGTPVQRVLGSSDAVLDVEITANRTDCMAVVGLAREIASIQGTSVRSPAAIHAEGKGTLPRVEIENPKDCLRYMARLVQNVRVGPSPEWLRSRLEATGVRSINNVVDVTNYVLRTWGQPIHAFDASKIGGNSIVVRRARAEDRLVLLDGKDVAPGPGVLVIADAARPMALAGIMGGLHSGVTDTTTVVVLESAQFSPELTREAARVLGLDTDASQRFGQGVDPAGVASALDETARLLAEVAGGTIVAERVDLWPGKEPPKTIRLRRQRLGALLGVSVERDIVTKSLAGLGILESQGWAGAGAEEAAVYEAPSHRKDLDIEVDLIEEVARVLGYDRIPARVRVHGAPSPGAGSTADFISELTTIGCGFGFDETINTALVGVVPPEVLPQGDEANLWELQNPMSRELKHLRPSLLPGILQTAARNVRHGVEDVRLIEVGKVFVSSPAPLGSEWREAAFLLSGTPDPWAQRGADSDRYSELKGAVDALLEALGIDSRKTGSYHEPCWMQGSGAFIEAHGRRLGRLGQVSSSLVAAAGLDRPAWAAVLDVAAVQSVRPIRRRFVPLPKYPASKRDLAVVVGREVSQAQVEEVLRGSGGDLLQRVRLFDVYEGEQLGPGERSLAYALEFRSADRTLHDREVDEALQSIVSALGATLGATLRGSAGTHSSAGRGL